MAERLLDLRGDLEELRRARVHHRARPARRRARDRQRDRPERRRQDDALQPDHRRLRARRGRDRASPARACSASSRTRSSSRGIARTFQTLRLFLNMTVKENVMAAAYSHTKAGIFRSILRTPGMRREEREIAALAEERLAFFGERLMGYRWNQPAYSLSYANRRRLEIARATATKPRLLLLDEPAAGMNPVETHEITELIARLREEARLHDPRDRARHARRRGHLRPRDRARPRRQDRRGHLRGRWRRTSGSSRPTSA